MRRSNLKFPVPITVAAVSGESDSGPGDFGTRNHSHDSDSESRYAISGFKFNKLKKGHLHTGSESVSTAVQT